MSDQKGKKFLELVDEQSNLQWKIISCISALIDSKWESRQLCDEIEQMVSRHADITRNINCIES
ncbi:MAG: hypothetical protein D9C04_02150 [Nitrosopumilus sp. B06]|nr:MAG: hypothetical protein EB828_00460 [Nitrosopumilus sp. D6]RNJ80228.1 MAG: hypothetical protein D9C04_02150 [Nitrosopumilus sp. B06]